MDILSRQPGRPLDDPKPIIASFNRLVAGETTREEEIKLAGLASWQSLYYRFLKFGLDLKKIAKSKGGPGRKKRKASVVPIRGGVSFHWPITGDVRAWNTPTAPGKGWDRWW